LMKGKQHTQPNHGRKHLIKTRRKVGKTFVCSKGFVESEFVGCCEEREDKKTCKKTHILSLITFVSINGNQIYIQIVGFLWV